LLSFSCILVTLKFTAGQQVCRPSRAELGLKDWAFETIFFSKIAKFLPKLFQGLCMGFSLISAAEILYHCFVSFCSDDNKGDDDDRARSKSGPIRCCRITIVTFGAAVFVTVSNACMYLPTYIRLCSRLRLRIFLY
jgi:hypothetical protein